MTLVQAIARELERRIVSGVYEVDSQLPTEPELASAFSASRTSIRAAVGELEARGLVSRKQGRGTFVRGTGRADLSMFLEANLSVAEVIRSAGYQPGISRLSVRKEVPPAHICRELNLPLGSSCVVVRRTRTASGLPVADSADYLKDVPGLSMEPSFYEGSLYETLAAVHKQQIISGVASISADVSDAESSARLEVPPATPVLLLRQVHEVGDHTPVMYSAVSLRSDVVHVYVHRGGEPATRST